MIERLPESWIRPDQIPDLRARVRLRLTLSEQFGEQHTGSGRPSITTGARSAGSR